jgi:hypothetical protein
MKQNDFSLLMYSNYFDVKQDDVLINAAAAMCSNWHEQVVRRGFELGAGAPKKTEVQ